MFTVPADRAVCVAQPAAACDGRDVRNEGVWPRLPLLDKEFVQCTSWCSGGWWSRLASVPSVW